MGGIQSLNADQHRVADPDRMIEWAKKVAEAMVPLVDEYFAPQGSDVA